MADTFAKSSISTEAAGRLVAAAEAKAAEIGKAVSYTHLTLPTNREV